MVSNAADFKKRNRRIVDLPSGLSVEIKRLSLSDFLGGEELPIPAGDGEEEKETLKKALQERAEKTLGDPFRFANELIVKGVIRPRFSSRPEDAGAEDVVLIDDLDSADYAALLKEITSFAGMNKETGHAAESFRVDGEQRHSGRPGAEIRETAH